MNKKYILVQILFLILPLLGPLISIVMSLVNISIIHKNKKAAFFWWFVSCVMFLMVFVLLTITGFMKLMTKNILIKLLIASIVLFIFGIICLVCEKLLL